MDVEWPDVLEDALYQAGSAADTVDPGDRAAGPSSFSGDETTGYACYTPKG